MWLDGSVMEGDACEVRREHNGGEDSGEHWVSEKERKRKKKTEKERKRKKKKEKERKKERRNKKEERATSALLCNLSGIARRVPWWTHPKRFCCFRAKRCRLVLLLLLLYVMQLEAG